MSTMMSSVGKDVVKVGEQYVSIADVQRVIKMEEYNSRPEVIARRKRYQKERNAKLSAARKLYRQAQEDPELAVKLGLGIRVAL